MTEAEARREQQVLALFEAFGKGGEALHAAIREVFADTCVWWNGVLVTTTGPEEAIAVMVGAEERGVHSIDFEVRHLAVRGDVVLSERVDHGRGADGTLRWSVPVTGVFEFEGDKLVAWREFFDSSLVANPHQAD